MVGEVTQENAWEWLTEFCAKQPDRGAGAMALTLFSQIDFERRRQRLTITALAARAGLQRSFVSRILNNPSNVTVGTIMRLANALDLEVPVPRLRRRSDGELVLPECDPPNTEWVAEQEQQAPALEPVH